MVDVNLELLRRLGNDGQIAVRHPTSSVDGFSWEAKNPFGSQQQVAVAFGVGPPATRAVVVTITDGQIEASSMVFATLQVALDRAADEFEMDPVVVCAGVIVNATSCTFTVVAADGESQPHGNYLLNYARI